jgi:hypothetical protein
VQRRRKVSRDRRFQIRAVATFMIVLFLLTLAPTVVSAQSLNGSIYVAEGASVLTGFVFSVSGSSFVVFIVTFGTGGHGRWFVAAGSTDGKSGTGQLFSPTVFTLPAAGSFQFTLDQPGAPTGSFTTQGLEGLLSLTSGRLVRIFP